MLRFFTAGESRARFPITVSGRETLQILRHVVIMTYLRRRPWPPAQVPTS